MLQRVVYTWEKATPQISKFFTCYKYKHKRILLGFYVMDQFKVVVFSPLVSDTTQ